ncbi:MAG: BatA domain-containing protein [Armatimonadota bacterium]
MGLSFINSGLLGALALVSIPIIIHLLQRKRFRVVRWGAMEFLRQSQRNRSRRLMIEQLLLLLIRCLIIALVVLALCRPIVRMGGVPVASQRGQVHAVIILDNSYSMGYRPSVGRAETVFDRARDRALDLVQRGLRQGDGVSVILASEPPRALIRQPSLDLNTVTEVLRKGVALSDAGTNFGGAARLAVEVLNESRFVNREVFLISDNQALGFDGKGRDPAAWESLAKAARLVMLPAREPRASNLAVEWVQAARGLATARSSARIQARVINRGTQAARGLLVTLEVDGQAQGSTQRIDVEPGQGTLVTFNQIFDRPGVRACTVRISEDRLPADDRGYLALPVRQNVKVLVLNGRPNPQTPQKDGAFFLQLALAPPLTSPGQEATPLEPRVITGSTFGGENVRGYDVVALSDVATLGEGDRRLLAEFVQNGGGAVIFLGSRVNASLYNRDLYEAQPSLLPARLSGVGTEKAFLDPASVEHPALQRFRGAQDVDLNTADFSRYFRLTPKEGDKSVQVMARFSNGAPAIVEKEFGLGRVILVASTANTEWNTLPLRPAFLPMVHQLIAYLASSADGTRNGRLGEPLVKPLPLSEAGERVTAISPKGQKTTLKPVVDERGAVVTVPSTKAAGFYRLASAGGSEDLFAVNRDPAEADLRGLDEAAVRKLLPVRELTWISLNDNLLTELTRSRQGIELWRHLLIAALALMAIETMLAQAFGRRS